MHEAACLEAPVYNCKYQTSRSYRQLRNVPNKNGFPYANVLAHFDEMSRMMVRKANIRVRMSPFQDIEEDNTPKSDQEYV